MKIEDKYMRRALQLASCGNLHAHPNPMVGAVIVDPSGRIIGEGWHRRCGRGHAEVNAVASVAEADRPLLRESTMYVTLEPCSHWGKTPPCARLIIETGIPRVVVATADSFPKVSSRGIAMLREAGVEVEVGLLGEESRRLNRRFIGAHTSGRPWVTLKWAESADGFIDGRDSPSNPPALISTPLTKAEVHKIRAEHDAILVGSGTFLADRPSLTVRRHAGDSPKRFVADRRGRIDPLPQGWTRLSDPDPAAMLQTLWRDHGVTSLLVEGGYELHEAFIRSGLYDDVHREVNHTLRLADKAYRTPAPRLNVEENS